LMSKPFGTCPTSHILGASALLPSYSPSLPKHLCLPIHSQGFDEQAIHFLPTFKLVPHSQDYHLQRVPAWTDRILHRTVRRSHSKRQNHCSLEPLYYRCALPLLGLDHCFSFASRWSYARRVSPAADANITALMWQLLAAPTIADDWI
jgi:hypothetical protein